MANPLLEKARELGYEMASGYAPRGEACFDAGKLICHVTSAAQRQRRRKRHGVREMDEARSTVKNELGVTDEELGDTDDAIDVIDSQYNGMAILGTF